MKFTLEIELGNDVMQTVDDVSGVLAMLLDSQRMSRMVTADREFVPGDGFSLRDRNGNKVGKWEVSE